MGHRKPASKWFQLLPTSVVLSALWLCALSGYAVDQSSNSGGSAPEQPEQVGQKAEQQDKEITQQEPKQQPGSNGQQQAEPLKAGVEKVEVTLDTLRDVGVDIKHLLAAANHLYDEVTMQRVTVETEPEIIGMGIIVPIPIGVQPVGAIEPARKDRVDLAMSQIRPVIQLFKTDVDEFLSGQKELDLSERVKQELEPYFKDWTTAVYDASAQLKVLDQLTKGSPYDQPAIAKRATAIHEDGKRLQKDLKKVYEIIRKEGKRVKQQLGSRG